VFDAWYVFTVEKLAVIDGGIISFVDWF